MSFAYWPAAETVERFNRQVERCGARRVGRGLGQWGKWLDSWRIRWLKGDWHSIRP